MKRMYMEDVQDRMDQAILDTLKRARVIKVKLELDRANVISRKSLGVDLDPLPTDHVSQ